MSEKTTSKSSKIYKQLKSKQSIDKQPSEDFDIVESDPDSYESSSDEGSKQESGPESTHQIASNKKSKAVVAEKKEKREKRVRTNTSAANNEATPSTSKSRAGVPHFGNNAHVGKATVQEKAEAAAAREKEIVNAGADWTWSDLIEFLDPTLIRVQFRFMFIFFCAVVICVLAHLFICYNFNEDLWYKYFPIDIEDDNLEAPNKYEL